MPYLVSTLQPSTAVSRILRGSFLGGASSDELVMVGVNHVTLCTVHDETHPQTHSAESDDGVPPPEVITLGRYEVPATIVLAEAVPILHPTEGHIERHLLFIVTAKDEYALFAFTPAPTTSSGAGLGPTVELVPLYAGTIESRVYQPHFDGAKLSAVTTASSLRGEIAAKFGGFLNAPMVAATLFHKSILLFDVLCCIAVGSSQGATPAILSLFSDATWKLSIRPRSKFAPVTLQFLDETTVYAIAFGISERSDAQQVPLYVLHADHRLRTHVVEYALDTSCKVLEAASNAINNGVNSVIMNAILGIAFDEVPTENPLRWTKSASPIQTDLEVEARMLAVTRCGILVMGSQLVTCVRTTSTGRKVVTTEAIPPAPRSEIRACSLCPSSDDATSADGERLVVAYHNGLILMVCLRIVAADNEDADRTGDDDATAASLRIEVSIAAPPVDGVITESPRGLPECLVALDQTSFIVGSLVGNTTAHRFTGPVAVGGRAPTPKQSTPTAALPKLCSRVIFENAGPVVNLAVVNDNGRQHIVASCGVESNAGLCIMRSSVPFSESFRMGGWEGCQSLLSADDVVCISTKGSEVATTRLLRFVPELPNPAEALEANAQPTPDAITIEELDNTPFTVDEETLLFSGIASLWGRCLLQVTPSCVTCATLLPVGVGAGQGHFDAKSRRSIRLGQRATHAALWHERGLVVIASLSQIVLYHLTVPPEPLLIVAAAAQEPTAQAGGHSCQLRSEVSCMDVSFTGQLIVGEWLGCRVTVYDISSGAFVCQPPRVIDVSAVPRSIASWPCLVEGREVACVGLMDGTTAIMDIVASRVTRTTHLGNRPVTLQKIQRPGNKSPNGVGSDCLLCCCDHPALLYQQNGGRLSMTGVAVDEGIEFACACGGGSLSPSIPPLLIGTVNGFHFGALTAAQQVTRTPLPAPSVQRRTVSVVTFLSDFQCIAAAVRSKGRDDIMLMPTYAMRSSVTSVSERALQMYPSFPLLENERCTFIDALVLGGNNELPGPHAAPPHRPTRAQWQSESWRTSNSHQSSVVIAIGTSFMFAEESVPRSSRFVYGTAEEVQGNEGGRRSVFVPLGEKDFTGALTCCAIVPHCPNRVALGINGSVVLAKWHVSDRDLVIEASVAVGFILVSIKPYFETAGVPATDSSDDQGQTLQQPGIGLLLVSDWRHSVCMMKVNAIDGGLEVCARDAATRGVMDAHIVPIVRDTASRRVSSVENGPAMVGHEVLLADEMMNLVVLQQPVNAVQDAQPRASRQIADDDEDGTMDDATDSAGQGTTTQNSVVHPAAPTRFVADKRLDTTFEIHIGDRITSMAPGSLSPCAAGCAVTEGIPGATGERFVYGTIHGSVGVITQVSTIAARVLELVSYFTMKQMESQLSLTVGPHQLNAEGYRDALSSGNSLMRSLNRRTSAVPPERRVKRPRSDEGPQLTRPKEVEELETIRGFVFLADIVRFVSLGEEQRTETAAAMTKVLFRDIHLGRHGFPSKPLPAKKSGNPDATEHVADPSEAEVDEANDVLRASGLPLLPLSSADIVALVQSVALAHE